MKKSLKIVNKKYTFLKITIILIVIFIIFLSNFIDYKFFNKSFTGILFDVIVFTILSAILIYFLSYLILKKERQQDSQMDQLIEAYTYIGQMNRKIDALLELDISSLDQSKNNPVKDSSATVFKQLCNIVDPEIGCVYLKPPINHSIFISKIKDFRFKTGIESLAKRNITEFKFSRGVENENYFKELGVADTILKKYNIVTKPIYMHQQNIGLIVLLFKKNQLIEDRDLNIIRVFSFYIALNATFKPDFSLYNT